MKNKAFTIIEILAVISIIAVLSSMFFFLVINPIRAKARDSQRLNDLQTVQKALEMYMLDHSQYPDSTESYEIKDGQWGSQWLPYLTIVPKDPLSSQEYIYVSEGSSYQIYTKFEKPEDISPVFLCGSCGPDGQYNGGITSSSEHLLVAFDTGRGATTGGGTTDGGLAHGKQIYYITGGHNSPRFLQAIIDPLDVKVGDTQEMSIQITDTYPITLVEARVETDTGIKTYKLSLTDGIETNGTWKNSWQVHDTHSETYRTTFYAIDSNNESNSITLTWTDPCSPPASGNWILDGNCSITGTTGVDNGNFTVATGYTMTLENGATFVFNSGKSITFSGGSIAKNSGGQIKKTNLWMTDADSDGYPATLTQVAQDSTPENGRRRNLMNTISSVDLDDANSSHGVTYLTPSGGWTYRKQVTVTNASANYQTKILVGESSGSSIVTTFTSSGIWTVPAGITSVEILVVAGGGGGGANYYGGGGMGGGGGGGGVIYNSNYSVTPGASLTVTVGAGGAGGAGGYDPPKPGDDGQNSVFNDQTAVGGGGGGAYTVNAKNGGSGGGAGYASSNKGTGTSGQGNDGGDLYGGGRGGGGGGKGAASTSYIGGAGQAYTISGSSVTYATGGDSHSDYGNGVQPTARSANTGDGGMGGWNAAGGAGGSGIVIVKYLPNVNCNSHVASDFDDLRFTGSDGTTLLDYWIESITGTTPNQVATVWVENDATPSTTCYMYYGNAGASAPGTSQAMGQATFPFFDHFDVDLSLWGTTGETPTIASSILTIDAVNEYVKSTYTGTYKALRFRAYYIGAAYQHIGWNNNASIPSPNPAAITYTVTTVHTSFTSDADSADNQSWASSLTGAYHNFDILWDNTTVKYYGDEILKITCTDTNDIYGSALPVLIGQITTASPLLVDWIFARNYTANEPTWGSWGSEQ